ncbi:maltose alpha-D-glucosyltransferase [Robbsia sp. Bb-Pol-6]|uniref:maltose alpha-D-glucosyltransferase n=1 Tax=Robbsia betulipollinis TaxID=2981849 RepID=A0ABT3ZIV2_9BURK|nr:maltose alpha-D-glucosyltransferase [Robbsia betulipollinis]MCY0386431.1 maltose alpha-D-glucosyltransferase [Robbsia betulipollinis]
MKHQKVALLKDDALWYKDAIIYQLHVKSFFDSNNDGVGDFPGLLSKLDYIAELGVDVIWLLPFYPSPRRDDGYDISDYRGVHQDYGTLNDFKRFIHEAHARGLRVITELVINHTSDQHPWFQRARLAKPGSNHRDYYVWSDTDKKYEDTRIIFNDTETSNWTHDPVAGAYYWHRFYSHQPDLNFDNPKVLQEVLSVMKFWLEMGVDGLRLDAIPYLVERDGTNNENLPETHTVLKKIRASLDAAFPNRMLLAEANQWPEDVQEYFGQGDECHMAFHFPLMPRIYMAIASEDRFPITDIMRQTPEIPEGCQWAIFLRNHDELTLEMVTDKERDYLWNTYASDRRARINMGIRRRLAPLLERDRRRIELINSLLLSMPGTPVIYYGDEIGMGDNIHLGDRDGVRTPMQWSSDRNGGFSRADPEQLVLPPVMGSLYGFDAVNVEAQSRDPHSLLNWMRRMLVTRRAKQAFGRGRVRFLKPANRKVLAYLRELDGEAPLLCVANLSSAPQAVELDLSEFAGHVPVELTADSAFPPIGQLTYLLTLPPYGFYWFNLCAGAARPTWSTMPSEQLSEFVTFVVRKGVQLPSADAQQRTLETEVLPTYLGMRRWFAAKDAKLLAVRLPYYTLMAPGIANLMLAEVEVDLQTKQGTRTDRYFLPMGICWDGSTTSPLPQQLAFARLRSGRTVGHLTDAFALRELPEAMLRMLRENARVQTPQGEVRFEPSSALDAVKFAEPLEIRWLSAEQSNSSLVIDEQAVLKLVRRIVPGIHPEAEVSRYLTERGFANTAPLLGEVVRVDEHGTPNTLAILQGYIENQGDAWNWALDYLRRVTHDLAVAVSMDANTNATPARSEEYHDSIENYGAMVGSIGKRLGELHALLAQPSDNPAFAPEVASAADIKGWVDETHALLSESLDILTHSLDKLDPDGRALAESLLARRVKLLAAVGKIVGKKPQALKTRIHGDFHLGQVLVAQLDAYLIDFEGEPARPVDERRRKMSPFRDVAGLLRSLSYAGAAAMPAELAPLPATDRRRALLERFSARAREHFLEAYRQEIAKAPQPLADAATEGALIDLFLVEKAAYEIRYEAANRPTWLNLPIRGLAALAARLLGDTSTSAASDVAGNTEFDGDEDHAG